MKGGGLKKPPPLETPEHAIGRHEGREYMASLKDSLVSRRNLLRLGALTGLATALSPVLRLGKAHGADIGRFPRRRRLRLQCFAMRIGPRLRQTRSMH